MLLLRIRLILILIQKFIDVHTIVHNGTFIVWYIRTRIQPHVNSECINSIDQMFCMINSDKGYRNLILVNYFVVLPLFWIWTRISNVHRFGVGAGLAHFFFFFTATDSTGSGPATTLGKNGMQHAEEWNTVYLCQSSRKCSPPPHKRVRSCTQCPQWPDLCPPSSARTLRSHQDSTT